MSFMNQKNILKEAEIDNIIKILRANGKSDVADKAVTDKKIQKDLIKLQKGVDKQNTIRARVGKMSGRKYKKLTVADYF